MKSFNRRENSHCCMILELTIESHAVCVLRTNWMVNKKKDVTHNLACQTYQLLSTRSMSTKKLLQSSNHNRRQPRAVVDVMTQ